jgi:hypothetical protein
MVTIAPMKISESCNMKALLQILTPELPGQFISDTREATGQHKLMDGENGNGTAVNQ